MNIEVTIPLVVLSSYTILITATLYRAKMLQARTFLLIYLLSSSLWALGYLLAATSYFPGYSSIFMKLVPLAALWMTVAYFQLICQFTRRHVTFWLFFGYIAVVVIAILMSFGYVPRMATIPGSAVNGALYGYGDYVFIAGVILFTVLPIIFLFQGYRSSSDADTRNKALYLMTGAFLVVLISARVLVPSLPGYSIELVVGLANGLLITYLLARHDLPDVKYVMKKCLTYMVGGTLIAPLYVVALWGLQRLSGSWVSPVSIATMACVIFVFPWLLFLLRPPLEKMIDRIIYKERLYYRQKMLNLPRKVTSLLSVNELARGMLEAIPKAIDATHVTLLLPGNSGFTSQFSNNLVGFNGSDLLELSNNSPIVKWLALNKKPLSRRLIDEASEFTNIRDEEKLVIQSTNVGLLVPIHGSGGLVGILGVGRKRSGTTYSVDDISLLTSVSNDSAVAIENAQLYIATKEKVHTDELTGLLNHGQFHQRIDEEIARCRNFGSVFSVLFLDIDLFKTYNDTFGHLAGDGILSQVAQCMKGSIRYIDVPFRYGGDEFAVILPQSSLDDAQTIGERIRSNVQLEMDRKGIALTCSIGIATWPTDGIGRESIIDAADKALYWSKQKGRNQLSLASELPSNSNEVVDIDGEHEVLNTIQALAATVDAKDHYTFGHSKKSSEYAVYIAKVLGYPNDKIAALRAAALLHDIGKLRVAEKILCKPGPLNDEEWRIMRDHPKFGVTILKPIKALGICLPIIQHHHERFDGGGYPAGLAANEIPVDARILAVADAYDAMTSERPYRQSRLSHQQAVDELARGAGTHFDAEIVKAFDALWQPLDSHVTGGGVSRVTKRLTAVSTNVIMELNNLARSQKETAY